MAVCFAAVPLVTAAIVIAREPDDIDCCFGRGIPVAIPMVLWSIVGALAFLWPSVRIIRASDGGTLTSVHRLGFWLIAVAVFVVPPIATAYLLETNVL